MIDNLSKAVHAFVRDILTSLSVYIYIYIYVCVYIMRTGLKRVTSFVFPEELPKLSFISITITVMRLFGLGKPGTNCPSLKRTIAPRKTLR